MKKAFVIRTGALGDNLIISPLFRALKREGYYVILNTGDRGKMVLKNNPFIDEIILYENEDRDNPDIDKYWKDLEKEVNADWCKNFAESIEVNVSLHPRSPAYIFPRKEREKRCDKNFYDVTEEIAGIKLDKKTPDVFLDDEEIKEAQSYLKKDKINVLWCMSGSGNNKVYPWSDYVMGELLKEFPDVHIITIGNEKCQLLESIIDDRITNLAGKIDFRISMALTKECDLVISPDTGVLHASGAFDTPKIGILGHTTITNVTKYFKNDYSLEADKECCECAPCFRLIYDHKIQCPLDNLTGAAWCMAHGQPAERLYKRITEVLDVIRKQSCSTPDEVSNMRS